MKPESSNGIRWSWCSSTGWRRYALWMLIAATLAGCVIVPTPPHRPDASTRLNVDQSTVQAVVPGQSLADVLLQLGEPDEVSLDGRQIAYRWERTWAYWFVGGGYSAAGGPLTRSRALLIELDEQDRVRSVVVGADNLVARPPTESIFTPEHGGGNTSANAPLHSQHEPLTQFHGEPLEFRAKSSYFLGFDAGELAGRSYWANLGKYPQTSLDGELLVTRTAIHFKRSGTFGTDAPDLSFRFKDIIALDYVKAGFSSWLVIRPAGRTPSSFTVHSGEAGGPANTKTFCERLVPLWKGARTGP